MKHTEGDTIVKPKTVVWLGIRNVGDASGNDVIMEAPLIDALKVLVNQILSSTMKSRFDITIARNGADALVGLRRTSAGGVDSLELLGFLDQLAGEPDDSETI
jgi:ABC-type phosphonate transport system ATPase subunit